MMESSSKQLKIPARRPTSAYKSDIGVTVRCIDIANVARHDRHCGRAYGSLAPGPFGIAPPRSEPSNPGGRLRRSTVLRRNVSRIDVKDVDGKNIRRLADSLSRIMLLGDMFS